VLAGYGVGAPGSWATTTAPNWASTYPKTGTIGGTSVEILAKIDMDGAAYAVVVPDGAAAPTSQQVKDGEDSTGTPVAAGFANSVALTADVESNMFVTNLTSETAYDVYVVAESSTLQDNPVKLDITTSDITDPINAAGYPKLSTIEETLAGILAKINEAGTGYFVVVPKDADAPSPAQVKAGQDSTGTAVNTGFYGSGILSANVETELIATNLSIGTQYDMYFIAEDSSLNLQDVVSMVQVSTLSKIINQINIPSSYVGSYVTIKLNRLIVTTDRVYPTDFTLVSVVGSGYEVVTSAATEFKIKILAAVSSQCKVSIKVNDGVNTSNVYEYIINVVPGNERLKSKPVGYTILTK